MKKAYIDIETNYIGTYKDQRAFKDYKNHLLTIVGIYLVDGDDEEVIQLIGDDCTKENILQALNGVDELVSYNGRSMKDHVYGYTGFDFPVIRAQTGVWLDRRFPHTDLCVVCWEKGLKGGLKAIEKRLGIERKTVEMDGKDAMKLWREYKKTGDLRMLNVLKTYNRDDILNLKQLEERLAKIERIPSLPEWSLKKILGMLVAIILVSVLLGIESPAVGFVVFLFGFLFLLPKLLNLYVYTNKKSERSAKIKK